MKKIAVLAMCLTIAATSFGQNDPLSISQGRAFKNGFIPEYSTGGFKVLVKNNVTGLLEQTAYTLVDDTTHGHLLIIGDQDTTDYLMLDGDAGISVKDTLFTSQSYLQAKTKSGTEIMTADTTQITINSAKLRIGSSTAPFITTGSGNPLNVLSAPVGTIYLRTDGVADSTLYIKSAGTDSAGWYPLMTN